MEMTAQLEEWHPSPVVRHAGSSYARKPAADHRDAAARLTERQAVFYRNLITMATALGNGTLPVDFIAADGGRRHLDRGCVKIAERAGFILPLADDPSGVVSTITLAFSVAGEQA